MKKIFAMIMSIAMLASIASTTFAAGELSRVFVSTSKSSKSVSKTFPSGVKDTMEEESIQDMMTELKNLTATKDVVQDITINSVSATSLPINYWIKLELPEKSGYSQAGTYSAIDYYSLKVTDSAGKVLYNDETAKAKTGQTTKSVNLGTLNNDKKRSETMTYKVYVSVNQDVNAAQLSDKPSEVTWNLAYTDDSKLFETTTAVSTAVPGSVVPVQTDAPRATATASPATTTAPTGTPAAKKIVVYATTDTNKSESIKPGTYRLVGSGHAVITDSTGSKKSEFDLKSAENTQAVTTLKEGDVLTVTGDSNAYVQFKAPTATATVKPSATAKATVKPTATAKATKKPIATAKTTAKPTATAKTNPKTGDTAPIVGVSVLAIMALGVVVYIGVTSKKKKNK